MNHKTFKNYVPLPSSSFRWSQTAKIEAFWKQDINKFCMMIAIYNPQASLTWWSLHARKIITLNAVTNEAMGRILIWHRLVFLWWFRSQIAINCIEHGELPVSSQWDILIPIQGSAFSKVQRSVTVPNGLLIDLNRACQTVKRTLWP